MSMNIAALSVVLGECVRHFEAELLSYSYFGHLVERISYANLAKRINFAYSQAHIYRRGRKSGGAEGAGLTQV